MAESIGWWFDRDPLLDGDEDPAILVIRVVRVVRGAGSASGATTVGTRA